jgi:S1-C subfamily serine protease
VQLIILLLTLISCSVFAEKFFLPAPFSHIAEKIIPAVVAIETEDAEGSGFFIGENGHIMTNSHLIESASSIHVITHDKQIFSAQIIKLDLKTDLAVIKIEESGFSHLTFGKPDDLKIGDYVLSIA